MTKRDIILDESKILGTKGGSVESSAGVLRAVREVGAKVLVKPPAPSK